MVYNGLANRIVIVGLGFTLREPRCSYSKNWDCRDSNIAWIAGLLLSWSGES